MRPDKAVGLLALAAVAESFVGIERRDGG